MLLTVEGGGFFSSSASGYSKGLTLLFFKGNKEERPMRVSPLAQYQLVDEESNSQLRLDSEKNESSRGCPSFVCFGRATEIANHVSSPKADTSSHHSQALPGPAVSSSSSVAAAGCIEEESASSNDAVQEEGERIRVPKGCLKKKKLSVDSSDVSAVDQPIDAYHCLGETLDETIESRNRRTRKLQWTDEWGKELYEIREFELSDDDLFDDEFGYREHHRRCQCVIQ